jgi:two-component system cell cycle sensor histidine kinase/response regulator CckA
VGGLSVFESTRLALARMTAPGREELSRGFLQAAQASARALSVARVGLWFHTADGRAIVCAAMWDATKEEGSSGQRLELASYPSYAASLRARRVVLAHDARSAPETRELAADYLVPNGITALLDAPIFHDGEVVGVACHEHVGPPRAWTDRERDLASSLADVTAVLLEQSARAEVEAALRQQQERNARLERQVALARLCAGVAHDFNNVLCALRLQLDLVKRHRSPGLEEDVARAVGTVGSGERLVQQLLGYARARESQPLAVHVNRAIEARRDLWEAAVGAGNQLDLDIAAERLVVEIDPVLLERMVMNLVTNAKEAMPSGGRVRLTLRGEGEHALLEVSDTGVGIEEAMRSRIFEPYFTTKGAGTGLGLSTVLAIVEKAGGRIDVQSVPGDGTTITVRLPRIEG